MALVKKKSIAVPKPFMLKDYLRDDFSSCSSNGFKSYPRRKCCTTVRFLMDVDRKAKNRRPISNRSSKPVLKRNQSKSAASTTMSALQRASVAVINAVKLLPFPSVKSPSPSQPPTAPQNHKSTRKALLSRSFSRKLLRRSFWRKNAKEEPERRCRSFGEILEEKEKPSDENTQHSITSTTTLTTITASRTSTSTSSDGNSNSNSFAESEFASDLLQLQSRSSNCCSLGQDDVVEGSKTDLLLAEKKVSKRVGVTVGDQDSMEAATTTCSGENAEMWPNHEEKEQFSPVSVLDCPFEDEEEEEEITSPFHRSLVRVEGTKQKLMQKIRRFESLAQLEPLDLEKRIAQSELEEEEEEKLEELLKQVKATIPSNSALKFMADNLLLDFFRERLVEDNGALEHELLKVARDWVNGQPRELMLGWEVQDGRKTYLRDMESGGRWRSPRVEERDEVVGEVEVEVWTSLVNELILDLI